MVRFVCAKYPNLRMVFKAPQSGWRPDSEGRQMVVNIPGEDINFVRGIFETEDPEKIEFIRAHGHFTGFSDKKVISESVPPDKNQLLVSQFIQQHGFEAAAALLAGRGITLPQATQPPKTTGDPVTATVQQGGQQTLTDAQKTIQMQMYQQQQMAQQVRR